MKTYWDLTDKERSCLTDEGLERYFDIELMKEGLVKPVMPEVIHKIDPSDKLKGLGTEMFFVDSVLFHSLDDAKVFLGLDPCSEEYSHYIGYEYKYAKTIPNKITNKLVYDVNDLNKIKDEMVDYNLAKERYSKELKEYNEIKGIIDDILSDIKEDREKVYLLDRKYTNIKNIFNRFLELAEGDKEIAMKFLKEKHTDKEIEKALEW